MSSCSIALPSAKLQVRSLSDRSLTIILIAVCLFSAALGRFCYLLQPFDYDASIFIYMGKMVSNGGRLCHDMVDNKFPMVGLMTSIVWRAFGTCWPAYIALQTVLSLVAAWILGRIAARATGPYAQLPTMLFAVVYLNFTSGVFGGFQLETLQVFFTVFTASAAVDALLSDRPAAAFVAGLCAGCGAMLKPTAMGILLAFALAIIIRKRGRPMLLILATAGGLCIPAIAALSYLISADLLSEMPALYRQISTYASQSALDAVQLTKPFVVLTVLGFPVAIRGYVCRRDRAYGMMGPSTAITIFAITWLVIETAGVVMQRRMYAYHFLPMVPPAALLFGMLPRQNRPSALAAALLPIAMLSIFQARTFIANTPPGANRLALSDYLANHTKSTDTVWADGWPRLMLETGLHPGARLPFTFLFANYDTAGLDYSATMIADFDRLQPAYIALPMPLAPRLKHQVDAILELNRNPTRAANYLAGWSRIEQYTLDHYTLETVVDQQSVYRRKP